MRRAYRSKPVGVFCAVLLAAIVIGGGISVLLGGGSNRPASAAAVAGRASASSSGCSLRSGGQSLQAIEFSPPAITDWHQVDNMWVPEAPGTLGPQHYSDGWYYCFADDPGGALLAAINVWASGTGADSTEIAEHYATVVTPPEEGTNQLPPGITLAGYQYVSYTPQRAVIEVVMDAYGRGDAEATTTMVWEPSVGDWRVAVPASESIGGSIVDDSLAGNVPWRLS
jgi:hypothetical protein